MATIHFRLDVGGNSDALGVLVAILQQVTSISAAISRPTHLVVSIQDVQSFQDQVAYDNPLEEAAAQANTADADVEVRHETLDSREWGQKDKAVVLHGVAESFPRHVVASLDLIECFRPCSQ